MVIIRNKENGDAFIKVSDNYSYLMSSKKQNLPI